MRIFFCATVCAAALLPCGFLIHVIEAVKKARPSRGRKTPGLEKGKSTKAVTKAKWAREFRIHVAFDPPLELDTTKRLHAHVRRWRIPDHVKRIKNVRHMKVLLGAGGDFDQRSALCIHDPCVYLGPQMMRRGDVMPALRRGNAIQGVGRVHGEMVRFITESDLTLFVRNRCSKPTFDARTMRNKNAEQLSWGRALADGHTMRQALSDTQDWDFKSWEFKLVVKRPAWEPNHPKLILDADKVIAWKEQHAVRMQAQLKAAYVEPFPMKFRSPYYHEERGRSQGRRSAPGRLEQHTHPKRKLSVRVRNAASDDVTLLFPVYDDGEIPYNVNDLKLEWARKTALDPETLGVWLDEMPINGAVEGQLAGDVELRDFALYQVAGRSWGCKVDTREKSGKLTSEEEFPDVLGSDQAYGWSGERTSETDDHWRFEEFMLQLYNSSHDAPRLTNHGSRFFATSHKMRPAGRFSRPKRVQSA
jgi:hypothetical protein